MVFNNTIFQRKNISQSAHRQAKWGERDVLFSTIYDAYTSVTSKLQRFCLHRLEEKRRRRHGRT